MGHTQSLNSFSPFLAGPLLLKVKTFQKTISSGILTNTILQSQAQEFYANYVPLFFIIITHSYLASCSEKFQQKHLERTK